MLFLLEGPGGIPGIKLAGGFSTNLKATFLGAVDMSAASSVVLPAVGSGAQVVTAASATAFVVGPNGATNPTFLVDTSTANDATGLKVKGAAAGAGLAMSVVSSGTNEVLSIDAKGSGRIQIGGTSTGPVYLARGGKQGLLTGQTLTDLGTVQNTAPTITQLLGGVLTHESTTGAGTATMPNGTSISGGIFFAAVGDTFSCLYANAGSQTVTITGATGATVMGTAAIPPGKNALITFINTGSNTWDVLVTVSA